MKHLNKIALFTAALVLCLLAGCSAPQASPTAYFSLVGNSVHGAQEHGSYETWVDKVGYEIKDGDTALDIITSGMEQSGYAFADTSYIYSVTKPDGTSLDAGSNGENSGWLFAVNGKIPDVGMSDYTPADGDHILLRYVDDFNTEVDWETNTFID